MEMDLGTGLRLKVIGAEKGHVWIEFRCPDAHCAAFELCALAEKVKGIRGDTLKQWAAEYIKRHPVS